MGHVCSILDFDAKRTKNGIQNECFRWQCFNADHQECGSKGPRIPVKWTNKVFESQEKAHEYLDLTFGFYDQTAVQWKTKRGKLMWAIACEVHH